MKNSKVDHFKVEVLDECLFLSHPCVNDVLVINVPFSSFVDPMLFFHLFYPKWSQKSNVYFSLTIQGLYLGTVVSGEKTQRKKNWRWRKGNKDS